MGDFYDYNTHICTCLSDAFKKNVTNFTLGGVSRVKMLHFIKLCLKSISSHFGKKICVMRVTPILSVLTYLGGKKNFCCKSAPKVV